MTPSHGSSLFEGTRSPARRFGARMRHDALCHSRHAVCIVDSLFLSFQRVGSWGVESCSGTNRKIEKPHLIQGVQSASITCFLLCILDSGRSQGYLTNSYENQHGESPVF
jgi:hypothetical protein